jgi:hypothetical protein
LSDPEPVKKDVLSGPYETRHFETMVKGAYNEERNACKYSWGGISKDIRMLLFKFSHYNLERIICIRYKFRR